MIIIYEKANFQSFPLKSGTVTFAPGKNVISKEKYAELEKYFSDYLEIFRAEGTIKIFKDGDKKVDLGELNTREAEELVVNTMNVTELKECEKQENARSKPRKVVLKKIELQIAKLEEEWKSKKNGKK